MAVSKPQECVYPPTGRAESPSCSNRRFIIADPKYRFLALTGMAAKRKCPPSLSTNQTIRGVTALSMQFDATTHP